MENESIPDTLLGIDQDIERIRDMALLGLHHELGMQAGELSKLTIEDILFPCQRTFIRQPDGTRTSVEKSCPELRTWLALRQRALRGKRSEIFITLHGRTAGMGMSITAIKTVLRKGFSD